MANTKTSNPAQRRKTSQNIDADTHKVEQSHASKSARPAPEERTRRREKGSVGGYRDILTVHPKDPNFWETYVTRWVLDKYENGQRIFEMWQNDWAFVQADEVKIGDAFVYTSENVGSIVRRPAGGGDWLYLMKKFRDWHEADMMEVQRKVAKRENYINRERDAEEEDGQYGSGKTTFKPF